MIKVQPGDIIFSSSKSGWFPQLVKFFTRSQWSHTGLVGMPFGNDCTVLEASALVQVVPYVRNYQESKNETFEVFRIQSLAIEPRHTFLALEDTFYDLAGDSYGKFQLVWFVWRWLNKLVGKDIRHQKNWMSAGVICSEVVYTYLQRLAEYNRLDDLLHELEQWNRDTVQAEDLYQFFLDHPDIFTPIRSGY